LFVSDATHYITIGTGTPTAAAANSGVQFANVPLWVLVNEDTSATLKAAAITA